MKKLLTLLLTLPLAFTLSTTVAEAKSVTNPATADWFVRPSRRSLRTETRAPQKKPWSTIDDVALDANYDNKELGLHVRYPSTWERRDLNQREDALNLVVMFLSKGAKNEAAGVRQNINVVTEDLADKETTLAEYTREGIAKQKEFLENFVLLHSSPTLLGGLSAQLVLFSSTAGKESMLFEQVWAIRNGTAYVWTFGDRAATFPKNVATFERMLDSLRME